MKTIKIKKGKSRTIYFFFISDLNFGFHQNHKKVMQIFKKIIDRGSFG